MSLMDYFKLRTPQLQHLAGGGDAAAKTELARRQRDAPATLDVTKATYPELRALVIVWRAGSTLEDRAQSFDLARRAQSELEARHRVISRSRWRPEDLAFYGPDQPSLPVAPWLIPPAPRCISWQRPEGSKLYPSEADLARGAMNAFARKFYAAGVPQPKE